ncbi:hypothetical protein BXY85_2388 [Roseivirga pacifica]|uniref:Uncharacterized protein n=1 Tax=Roseivirga pacifica TaxID=1267423 RepID=A0A1I0NPU4_9BACT|nr:hypothetical protein BXY85_2388 [Roseivirga pacifica]SEW03453.1 hypothetical protein SAMN05216290_1370 [Roseivirga pacifica]
MTEFKRLSKTAIPYRKVIVTLTVTISLLSLTLYFQTLELGTLIVPASFLILGGIFSLMIPNTYKVSFSDSSLKVNRGNKETLILLSDLKYIEPRVELLFNTGKITFYDIGLNQKTEHGGVISFQVNNLTKKQVLIDELRERILSSSV